MSLNQLYMIAPSLQEYFVDKDTGAPLAAGVVTFYKDQARTVLKTVYRLSGSPPNYTYTALQNPVTLSAVGTFQDPDTGDDILPYYYPYDDAGNVELYYITVYSSIGVFQFDREGWPNVAGSENGGEAFVNYVPDGQFLIHTDIPAAAATPLTPAYVAGQIRAPITTLAQGGWTFERPNSSTATDIVTFPAFGSAVTNPSASPQYSVRVVTQVPGAGDTFKDLRLKFQDVNKFASETQQYTFAFSGKSNGSAVSVALILIKNFGSGGSATSETPLANLTIPAGSFGILQKSFTFGTNTLETIGDDSYLQLAIRFPLGVVFDVQLTDFILTIGAQTVAQFPPTPDADFKTNSIAGWMPVPAYDSSDLYLPLRLTPSGLEFDHSIIGKIFTTFTSTLNIGELACDGSQYETAAYSSDGIPYSRLQHELYKDPPINLPLFGTGLNYFTGVFPNTGNELRVTNNSPGSVTDAADGTPATGFTFNTIHTGATTYYCKAYLVASDTFYIQDLENGNVGFPSAGTSGFTCNAVQDGNALIPMIGSVQTIAATTLAGKYFEFSTSHGGTNDWYVWFTVDGAGADPAPPGRTGILVKLGSTDTADIVAQKIQESLNGWQVTTIKTVAASSIPAGAYFSINSINTSATVINYYVWYTIDGAGTDPAPLNKIAIPVALLSTDTNTQVALKTQTAINMKYFAVPDLRGIFFRGWDNGAGVDPDAATRFSLVPGIIGDVLGTFERDSNQSHLHTGSVTVSNLATATSQAGGGATIDVGGGSLSFDLDIDSSGGSESRPTNISVNYVIKY